MEILVPYICNTLTLHPLTKSRGPSTLSTNPADLRSMGAGLMEMP